MKQMQLAPPPVSSPACQTGRFRFGFGRKFFLLTILGILWAVPAFWDLRFLLVMAAWDLCAFAAWAVDLARLPRPEMLVLERSWNGVPSLNNPVEVVLELRNGSSTSIDCRILEDVPHTLRSEPPQVEIRASARDSASASYRLLPLRRGEGENKLGPAYLRYQSSAGFAERWARAELG